MRFIRVCLLFTLFVHPVFGAKFVHQSSRQIPVVRKVDLIVIGGTLGAVAAATEAAEEGVNVLLVGSRPYIGEDICATMRLWLNEGETLHGKLTKQIFSDKHITTPINVKKTLEAALLDAGVGFMLCCYPTDILSKTMVISQESLLPIEQAGKRL